ncbi:HNH endonuclease [Pseudoalteromonas phage H101]|uniref:Uncharacterized protein n=1 Tax=Pseudoalteromonas phage H101 TaxID=1654919 RepID=A0A0H4IP11_9CAUD|nr:HNH endonuclease [Pseudoalteromonas phage H101]AKO61072.1 hypothetical protein [Pseudoalteromonas phage H101]
MSANTRDEEGRFIKKHGMINTRFYHIWEGMKARCTRETCNGYEYYGGKGITFDESWSDFKQFYDDMYEAYQDGLTLDRLDNTKDYSVENCKWSTITEQVRNKSDNRKVTIEGLTLCLSEWRIHFNLTKSMVYKRNLRGELGYHLLRPSRHPIVEGSDYGLKGSVEKLKLTLDTEHHL